MLTTFTRERLAQQRTAEIEREAELWRRRAERGTATPSRRRQPRATAAAPTTLRPARPATR